MRSTTLEFIPEALLLIPLIPDEREFKERIIDDLIAWISADDPNSPYKTQTMVQSGSEICYFQERKQALERERQQIMHQRWLQYQQEVPLLKKTTYLVSQIGPKNQVDARQQQLVKQEIAKLQQMCKQDLQLITGRFNTLIQQCDERIAQAQAAYQESFRLWLAEQDSGDLEDTY